METLALEKKELPFGMAEEVKNLRTSIIFSGDNIKTVMFTSCMMNEGKSTITIEIARSFAELDKKTLLIDTDFRKSIMKQKLVSGKITCGLTHYLTGQCELSDVIYKNMAEDEKPFYIIPAGPATSSPTELLSSEKFQMMMAQLRAEYDMIIVDTPPLGSVVDASIIAPNTDGAVLVIAAGKINYKMAQKVRDKLKASNCKVLGVAMNKVDKSKNSYGYYKYGKEYGYRYNHYYAEGKEK